MTSSTEVLIFALLHETDPNRAARLADCLGQKMLGHSPGVAYPPAWVLTKSKRDVVTAAYAIAYCDHPPTLHSIALRDHRVGVRLALAKNPHLSPSTVSHLAGLADRGCPGSRDILAALEHFHPAPVEMTRTRVLADPAAFVTVLHSDFFVALLHPRTSKTLAQSAVKTILSSSNQAAQTILLGELLLAAANRQDLEHWCLLWEKLDVPPNKLVSWVSPTAPSSSKVPSSSALNKVILSQVSRPSGSTVSRALSRLASKANEAPGPAFSDEIINLFTAHRVVSSSWSFRYGSRPADGILSDATLERLKVDPAWAEVLLRAVPTAADLVDMVISRPNQLDASLLFRDMVLLSRSATLLENSLTAKEATRLLSAITDEAKELLLLQMGANRQLALATLKSLSPDYIFGRLDVASDLAPAPSWYHYTSVAEVVLSGLSAAQDEVVSHLLDHASPRDLLGLLSGQWRLSTKVVLSPPLVDIPHLLDRSGIFSLTKNQTDAQNKFIAALLNSDMDDESVCAISEYLPDPARQFYLSPRTSAHFYSLLAGLDMDFDRILDHLSTHPELSLQGSIKILKAVSRLSGLREP